MLRHLTILTLMVFSLHSFAGQGYEYLSGQKELQEKLQSGNYKEALRAWDASTQGTAFAESQTGIATWAWLLYQNGLPYTALQTLLTQTVPSSLDSAILKVWTVELKNSPMIQKGWILTSGAWKSVVNNAPVSIRIKTRADIAKAFSRANAISSAQVNERARIWWQIATQAPLINDVDASLRALKLLKESGQTVIGQDMVWMTQGRALYQKKELEAAIDAYQQIPKSSNIWMESVEERAWAHLRRDDYDSALGVVTTALSPALAPLAGPETFFLANLMAFKACDYSRVFNNSEIFKKRHRARLQSIQELASKGTSEKMSEAFARFDKNGVNLESVGPLVEFIPQGMIRDREFVREMESRRQVMTEIAKVPELVSNPSAQLSRTLDFEKMQAERFKQQASKRAVTLAKNDVKEYKKILNKMHIIEGEIIERLHMDDNLKGQRGKLSKVDDGDDKLIFPVTQEVWMDELDNYKARVKDCPTLKKASL